MYKIGTQKTEFTKKVFVLVIKPLTNIKQLQVRGSYQLTDSLSYKEFKRRGKTKSRVKPIFLIRNWALKSWDLWPEGPKTLLYLEPIQLLPFSHDVLTLEWLWSWADRFLFNTYILRVHKALFHYLVFYKGILFQLSYNNNDFKFINPVNVFPIYKESIIETTLETTESTRVVRDKTG